MQSRIDCNLSNLSGEFRDFRKEVVAPIRKAFAEKECLTLVSSGPAADGDVTTVQRTQEVAAEGLRLLRNLHKQVRMFECHLSATRV